MSQIRVRGIVCLVALSMSCAEEPGTDANPATETVQSAIGGPAAPGITYNASYFPNLEWADFLSDMGELGADAASVFGYISSVSDYVNAAIAVAKFLGILNSPSEVQQLKAEIEAIAIGSTFQAAGDFVNTFYPWVVTAIETLADRPWLVTPGSDYDTNSQTAVNAMLTFSAWDRTKVGTSNDAISDGGALTVPRYNNNNLKVHWKDIITDRAGAGTLPNNVFDWRLGAPYLLKALEARLAIIAQMDPTFQTDHMFETEISNDYTQLLALYTKMRSGVKCASRNYSYYTASSFTFVYGCELVCADIYTGIASLSVATPNYPLQTGNTTAQCENINLTDMTNQTVHQVVMQMPLYEMRVALDLLYKILHPTTDLTVAAPRIVDSKSGSCIDTVGGSSDNGTNLTLAACDSSRPSQQWKYNRETGQIKNLNWNKCIDQRWGVTYGVAIGIWDCDTPHAGSLGTEADEVSNLAQRWTYSTETGRLLNSLGTWAVSSPSTFGAQVLTTGFVDSALLHPFAGYSWR